MSVAENKRIAKADLMCIGPEKLEEKLGYYSDNLRVWDSVFRVMGYAESNTVTGFGDIKKFYTWLANLPPSQH